LIIEVDNVDACREVRRIYFVTCCSIYLSTFRDDDAVAVDTDLIVKADRVNGCIYDSVFEVDKSIDLTSSKCTCPA
jgi:hypothetical protein